LEVTGVEPSVFEIVKVALRVKFGFGKPEQRHCTSTRGSVTDPVTWQNDVPTNRISQAYRRPADGVDLSPRNSHFAIPLNSAYFSWAKPII
jgi:hypothetical protein